jgi:hypothetical protein
MEWIKERKKVPWEKEGKKIMIRSWYRKGGKRMKV